MAKGHKRPASIVIMSIVAFLFLGSTAAMLRHQEPFFSWYYCFAWWSYIAFAEAWLHYHGARSLLMAAPQRFLRLLPVSLNIWLLFEVFNFRLHNWAYINLPVSMGFRWLGYAVSFATVLPAIFTTSSLLESLGLFRTRVTTRFTPPKAWYRAFVSIGLGFLLLSLLWPRFFFPLVWGGFIFLLEPLNHRFGATSLMRQWEQGSLRYFYLLLAAGAVCGLLWESWNFWAGSKWVYTIPFVDFFKIFEMPILGFLGFPPFAVECYVMVASVQLFADKLKENLGRSQYFWGCVFLTVLLILLDCWIFSQIDRWSVVSYRC